MKRCLSILFPILLFFPSLLAGQEYRWFHHIHAAQDDVRAIFPDNEGRVWFGTNRGLFRHGDFQQEIHYELYPEEFQRGVIDIGAFDRSRLLVQTRGGNYFVYDSDANQARDVETFLARWGIETSSETQMRIHVDPKDGIWISRGNRLYRKDPSQDKAQLKCELQSRILRYDSDGDRFCAITDSLIVVSSVDNPHEAHFVPHGLLISGTFIWLALDDEGNVWVGSDGLYRFPSESYRKECVMEAVSVMDILRSRSSNILVATGHDGIYSFRPDGTLSQHIEHSAFVSGSIFSNNIRSIREGTDGALWVCYVNPSVSVCQPGGMDPPYRHILPLYESGREENVSAIAQAPDGTIWFGTDGQGLFCQDPRTGAFTIPDISLSQSSVTTLFFDSKGRCWIGTYMGGLYCHEGNKTIHMLDNTSCMDVVEDRSGNIWAGMSGQGVYWIPGDLKGEPIQVDVGSNRWINQLAEGPSEVYAATTDGILSISLDKKAATALSGTKSPGQSFANRYFSSIVQDSRSLLWAVGTRSDFPLEIYDPVRDTIMHIPGLENENIRSIVEDEDRNIWLGTEQHMIEAIVNFDTQNQRYTFHTFVYQISSMEYRSGSLNPRSAVRLSDGTLLFGGSSGYSMLSPSDFPPRSPLRQPPLLSVAAYQIYNDYYRVNQTILQQGLKLRHDRNDLSLIISAQNYTSPFATNILYRFKNKDSVWRPVRGNIIELNHLPPGHYELEVSNGNPDGGLAGAVIPFVIDILSPWYQRGWAKGLAALLIVSLISLIAYYFWDQQKKKNQLALVQQEAQREHQLNDMKLRFFTNISHDIRTPLSLIITPLETYLNDEKHKEESSFLRPVYRNAIRLLNLVNQILDFQKLEADSMGLNLSYGNIVPFTADICSSFSQFGTDTGKRIEFSALSQDISTSFDKDKLSKILMNLLSNAFKFSPKDGTVKVEVSSTEEAFTITVADNGPGIPDAQKKEIFERFYQYHSENSTYIGSGIGLHIVREFVRLHDGTISVSDNTPTGAIFTVTIPLRGKEARSVEEADDAQVQESVPRPAPEGKRLLLVEDNIDFLDFLKDQLSDEFQVFTAKDGREGLEILQQEEDIDIIISDIMMAGMDGLAFCSSVKSNLETSHIPFILLTAKAMAEDEIQGLKLGADDYVTKPFHMQILRLRIRKLLEARVQSKRQFSEKLEVNPSEITITPLDEQFLSKAIALTEENMADPSFSVEKLASMLGMHRAHLYKKLLSITGKTPLEFIRIIRLKRAAQYLLKSQLYVSEIAYQVGYNSPKLFAKQFRDEFGMLPSEYQKKNATTAQQ